MAQSMAQRMAHEALLEPPWGTSPASVAGLGRARGGHKEMPFCSRNTSGACAGKQKLGRGGISEKILNGSVWSSCASGTVLSVFL